MIAHVAWHKRSEGHPGGVAKFGWYLERCVPAVRQYSWADYPCPVREPIGEPARAILLGSYLWEHTEVREADRIVCDGFWAAGFPDDAPVVVICHGAWAELARKMGDVEPGLIAAQRDAYRRFPVVAVSRAAAAQCEEHYGVEPAAVVNNAVDLDVFHPDGHQPATRPEVLFAGWGYAKGADIIHALAAELAPEFDFQYLDAAIGEEPERFRRGDLFVHPSRHEGNAYAVLEAMATGLPVLGSAVGLLATERDPRIGIVLDNWNPTAWADAIRELRATRDKRDPRGWLTDRGITLEAFGRRWREVLRVAGGGAPALQEGE